MRRIISVSRRTDVPAFYGAWFSRRLEEGFAGWENPFGGRKYLVSLAREEVLAFVFWSKNYRPFLPALEKVRQLGYPAVFNYTITGLPRKFECKLVATEDAVDSLITLSQNYSPDHINWRYDPVLLSSETPAAFHEERFAWLCDRLRGHVRRCYFSFVVPYGKVERNFRELTRQHQITFLDPPAQEKRALAGRLAEIAEKNGITMYTCCGDYLIGKGIEKAHCVDGDIISRLYFGGNRLGRSKPTRKECGCTISTDIGKYDTCPHGCIYCYANTNKEQAGKAKDAHDQEAAFLGYGKEDSDHFVAEIRNQPMPAGAREEKGTSLIQPRQLSLF